MSDDAPLTKVRCVEYHDEHKRNMLVIRARYQVPGKAWGKETVVDIERDPVLEKNVCWVLTIETVPRATRAPVLN